MDITTATPAQIDEALAEILGRRSGHAARVEQYDALAVKAEAKGNAALATDYRDEADRYEAKAADCDAQAAPFDAEYERRGGWTRAYFVQGGHVHRSTRCFTLQVGTRVGWLTEVSGMTQEEIVDLAGERACTFCYPDAPVAVLARPSQLSADVADRKAAAEAAADKAAKKAAKEAKAITNPDGSPLRGRWGVINTVVTAWNEAVSDLADVELYGYTFGPEEARANLAIVEALAAKLGITEDEVRETMNKKVAAKVKRDRR